MSYLLKRTIPLGITFTITVLMLLNYYLELPIAGLERILLSFSVSVLTAAIGVGVINLFILHGKRIANMREGQWPYSILLLGSMIFTVVIGLIYGGESEQFSFLYDHTLAPLGATLMSIFIVWIAPAFPRYLRIRDIPSAFLVLTILACIFTGSPLGQAINPNFRLVNAWLQSVGQMGASRGLKITIALGLMMISVRIITGREKSFFREGLE
jgi:hypothetical protein